MKVIKKILVILDLGWEFILPYLACMYLVYSNAEYTNQIILYGWISCMIHFTITGLLIYNAGDKEKENTFIFSFISAVTFGLLLFFGYLSIRGYLLASLMGEVVATILAFMTSLLFGKNGDGQSANKKIGGGVIFLNFILFVLSIYPFIQEWVNFLLEMETAGIYWLQGFLILIFATMKKYKGISSIVKKQKTNYTKEDDAEKPKKTNKTSKSGVFSSVFLILGSLFLWFGVLALLANIN
ncbi:MAG: hypothetical protein GY810_27995 [Aureispira sp.]|nr:hypothetical protein [Aureispira sp.]